MKEKTPLPPCLEPNSSKLDKTVWMKASKQSDIFEGKKELKSDTVCSGSIISLVNMGKHNHWISSGCATTFTTFSIWCHYIYFSIWCHYMYLADQPVPFTPSLPISPKYSPMPRDFNLHCTDLSWHVPVVFSSLGSLVSLHFFNGLQSGVPIKLWHRGYIFANV